ncbi:hypothetical protein SEPCBS57363_000063 [Sporothrix epigloea]|uniref:Peptidase S53 domain-containing protein n=1 Tax=Sporothrix epigloea TaxID=1892477 RepID=A0ABP0D2Q7_9PEZI
MHLNALTCAAILGFTLKAAAGPVPEDKGLAGYGRQVHAATNEAAATYKKTKRVIPDTHMLHERQPKSWASRWERTKRAAPDAILPMRIGLKQRNVDDGHNRLMAVSDPKSPDYGKHMSAEEVIDFFAPPRTTVDIVVNWLTSAGIHIDRVSQSTNRQWIQFDATVAEAEELLMTEYHIYEHVESGANDLAAEDYHVPSHVREHIDYVTPGIRLRRDPANARKLKRRQQLEEPVRRRSVKPTYSMKETIGKISPEAFYKLRPYNLTNCDRVISPECVRYLYDIPLGTTATPGNEMGVFESLGDHYSKLDLDVFVREFAPFIPNGTYPIPRLIDGATGATDDEMLTGAESNLDFQALIPIIYPQKSVLFQTDDAINEVSDVYWGFFNNFFDAIDGSYCSFSAFGEKGNCVSPDCADPVYPDTAPGGYNGTLQCGVYKPTNVISISYGFGEIELPDYYLKRQCVEVMKLGLQGVTVVMSSGDNGVAGYDDYCAGDDGQIFFPDGDAVCPYVLAVGSTVVKKAGPAGPGEIPRYVEVATDRFPSGGGFSNYFPAPGYQIQSLQNYFRDTPLNFTGYRNMGNANFSDAGDGVYHIGGRGYPDVSAIGDNYVIALADDWALYGGTSLAAPIWGAVLTRVNEERLAVGKRPVGFVNPALYAYPEVLNDITVGDNANCGTGGFPAGKGWDPVTGLGSPNFPRMVELFKTFA